MEDFQVHCGVALNVFTAWKPDDLFALAAIFRKTNEIAIALRCRPEEYPIKAVYGGGGYNAETSLQILQAYLYELQLARIVPDETRFNVTLQTHLGPTALDLENPAYDLLSHGSPAPPDQRTRTPPQRTLDTTTRTIKSTMERIGAQAAPVIMALRPLHEFALLWSQFSLNQTDPKFSVRNAYKDSVRLEPWLIDPENVKASMLTFRRSRIAMYQGNGHFEEMGRFFAEQIRNATGSDSLLDNVRRLEEIFVTWPKQFLVVDRDAYTWVANLPQDLLEVWSRLAWLDNSVVPADNLLMPFCLALRTNQVYKSFVKVNYAGRDPRTDRYAWPEATAGSTGSVWFTNASASTAEPDSDTSPWLSKADYREHRMKLDLKALYFDAWAPLPL
ncbi:MAG: hypothetical protein M1832_002422 [Thelocarpon impressellum]|nr:MAG: hypothetical protein M1832_002422 [Thelocarpon impressellum]